MVCYTGTQHCTGHCRYSQAGWVGDLPSLTTARYYHACGGYTRSAISSINTSWDNSIVYLCRDDGVWVLLVAGGLAPPLTPLSSTELLAGLDASAWTTTTSLPLAISGSRGAIVRRAGCDYSWLQSQGW